jgi:SAM-dependent methyltransferase
MPTNVESSSAIPPDVAGFIMRYRDDKEFRSEYSLSAQSSWPSKQDLYQLFLEKYGSPEMVGWSPRRRLKAGYFLPTDIYEATVAKHVLPGCVWLDVGGGHSIFPDNPVLARRLVSECRSVVAVDPDPSVRENAFATESHQCRIEDYVDECRFNLATFRMVVEHMNEPNRVVRALRQLLLPGATAIVFTVNRWSPASIASKLIPFRLHHPIKRLLWRSQERDTFPIHYRMNTRAVLCRLFAAEGFTESMFTYLDDLSIFGRSKAFNAIEFAVWTTLRHAGIRYPENCLLGVYRAPGDTRSL